MIVSTLLRLRSRNGRLWRPIPQHGSRLRQVDAASFAYDTLHAGLLLAAGSGLSQARDTGDRLGGEERPMAAPILVVSRLPVQAR